jgi:hypothetical protein
VAEACLDLSIGAHVDDEQAKRALLDKVQLQVWVGEGEWWADGIVPGLTLRGLVGRANLFSNDNAACCSA